MRLLDLEVPPTADDLAAIFKQGLAVRITRPTSLSLVAEQLERLATAVTRWEAVQELVRQGKLHPALAAAAWEDMMEEDAVEGETGV